MTDQLRGDLAAQCLSLLEPLDNAEKRVAEAAIAAIYAKERLRDLEAGLRLDETIYSGRTEAQREAQVRAHTLSARAELALAQEGDLRANLEFRRLERRRETILGMLVK